MSCEGCAHAGNCNKDTSQCGVNENPKNHIQDIVCVMSGKGGVGKSTVTATLAKALHAQGKKVGVLDADITGPSIPRLFGVQDKHAMASADDEILPIEVDGVKLISLNFMMENEEDPVIWRGPVIANVVKQLYTDVLWEDIDVLLIDMPPGTGDVALTIMQSLPVSGVVMVSTPQPMVSMIVSKAIRMCQQMEVPVYGVIENMAYLQCPNCNERIEFYNPEDLDAFIGENNLKLYATLPMVDLLRDINKFDESYSIAQQQETVAYMEQAAKYLLEDLQ